MKHTTTDKILFSVFGVGVLAAGYLVYRESRPVLGVPLGQDVVDPTLGAAPPAQGDIQPEAPPAAPPAEPPVAPPAEPRPLTHVAPPLPPAPRSGAKEVAPPPEPLIEVIAPPHVFTPTLPPGKARLAEIFKQPSGLVARFGPSAFGGPSSRVLKR